MDKSRYKNKKIIFLMIIILMISFFTLPVMNFTDAQVQKSDIGNNARDWELNLLEIVKIRTDIANEKENAYDKAINQTRYYVNFFGIILIIIAIGFGFYRDKKIKEAKDELMTFIKEKKKSLEESNANAMEKKMMELEKGNILKVEEIKDIIIADIKDMQERIKNLEISKKITESENVKAGNEDEVLFKDKNPYD